MLISQVLFTPQSSPPRASRDAASLPDQTSVLCALSCRTPASKACSGQCSQHPAAPRQGLAVGRNRRQDRDSKGQCGAAKELHKALAKQLTPETGEEITRTMSHFPAKEDTRGDTRCHPWFQQLVHEMMQARAAGGRDGPGRAEGTCPHRGSSIPCQPHPITSGQGMSLQMMTDAALIPDTIVQNKKLFYAKLSQPPDQPHLSSRVPPAQASMHALAVGSGTGWHQGPKPSPPGLPSSCGHMPCKVSLLPCLPGVSLSPSPPPWKMDALCLPLPPSL